MRIGRTLALVGAFALVAGRGLVAAGTGDGPPAAYRVASSLRALTFDLPGSAGRVSITTGAVVRVESAFRDRPLVVSVERGEAVVDRAGVAGHPVVFEAGRAVLQIKAGTGAAWRSPDTETVGAGILAGEVGLAISGKATQLAVGQSVQLVGGAPVTDSEAGVRAARWRAMVEVSRGKTRPGWLRVPGTVPPSVAVQPSPVTTDVSWQPQVGGGTFSTVPAHSPKLGGETLPGTRRRLLVSMPGEGMAGPGFALDFDPSAKGRVHNVLWTSSGGLVRFFLNQDWLVTLAPGTVLALDGPHPTGADRSPVRMHLASGALMVETRTASLAEVFSFLELTGGSVGAGGTQNAVASRQMVVVSGQPSGPALQAALAQAREALSPSVGPASERTVQGALGGPRARLMTLLCQMPAPAESLGRYLPLAVHSTRPIKQIEVAVVDNGPAAIPLGLWASERGPRGFPMPLATVLPVELEGVSGSNPSPYALLLTQQWADPWTLLALADRTASKVPGVLVGPRGSTQSEGGPSPLVVIVIVLAVMAIIPGVWERVYGLLTGIVGIIRSLCPRCGLVLDVYPLGEFRVADEQEVILQLVRFDSLDEVAKQAKSRTCIADQMQGRLKPEPKGCRLAVRGTWCQRCLCGAVVVQLLLDDRVVDEMDWTITSADTFKLLQSLGKGGA